MRIHDSRTAKSVKLEVLVVGRSGTIDDALGTWLDSRACQAVRVDNTDDALRRFSSKRPEFVVLDVTLPGGTAALEDFRQADRDVPVVAVVPRGLTARAVEAMKLGAADVVTAPFVAHDVEAVFNSALRQRQVRRERAMLEQEVRAQSKHTILFGAGAAMAEVRASIDRHVGTQTPVLIQGECGTGKELVAWALGGSGVGHVKPFVKISCAALPSETLEAELFGFERGVFTGPVRSKPGRFEMASGGTMLLDDVGEIPLTLQSRVLQAVQHGRFSRLGGHAEFYASVRVIAATNSDLDQAVLDGRFRQDLLSSLNVVPIWVPPLRERRDDIPSLAEFFLKRWSVFFNRRCVTLSPAMIDDCVQYGWPGNVRELENLMKRTVVLGSEAPARQTFSMKPSHTLDVAAEAGLCSLKEVSRLARGRAEAEIIARMLDQTGGNRKQAAINLGISYKALLYKAKAHGLAGRDLRRASIR